VIDGGFLDVDIKISGPENHVMHESEKESSGKYTFVAPAKGTYTVCFNNERSSMTPKLVMFSIDVGEAPQRAPGAPGEEEVGHTKLEDMIRELSGTLTSVKHEQEYMHVSAKSRGTSVCHITKMGFLTPAIGKMNHCFIMSPDHITRLVPHKRA